MKNEIMVFEKEGFGRISVVIHAGSEWFVAADVASVLQYSATGAMTKLVDSEDKTIRNFLNGTTYINQALINESGLYSAIFSSTLPKAKEFKRWVTSEVLPSIRKTGGYSITKDDNLKNINLHEIADHLESSIKIASLLGLDKNQSIHSANTMVRRISGFDCMREFGVLAIEYKENIQYHTPSVLGDMSGISAVKMNRILEEKGLQYETRDHRNKLVWVITPKGKEYSRLFDTKKLKSDGTSIMQVKWAESVLSI